MTSFQSCKINADCCTGTGTCVLQLNGKETDLGSECTEYNDCKGCGVNGGCYNDDGEYFGGCDFVEGATEGVCHSKNDMSCNPDCFNNDSWIYCQRTDSDSPTCGLCVVTADTMSNFLPYCVNGMQPWQS